MGSSPRHAVRPRQIAKVHNWDTFVFTGTAKFKLARTNLAEETMTIHLTATFCAV